MTTPILKARRWTNLQACYRANRAVAADLSAKLRARYGEVAYAPDGKQARLTAAYERVDRLADACYAWLAEFSPRYWRAAVPETWVCTELSYHDAITRGELSAEPPLAYGATRAHQRAALAVRPVAAEARS
jgi:hypothetical protein